MKKKRYKCFLCGDDIAERTELELKHELRSKPIKIDVGCALRLEKHGMLKFKYDLILKVL